MSDDEEKVLRFPRTERHHLNDVLDNLRQLSGRSLGYYKLVGRIPVPVESASLWAKKTAERTVTHRRTGTDPWCAAKTVIGMVTISTVFDGLDHSFVGNDPPLAVRDDDLRRQARQIPEPLLELGPS
jgi:hypothetical protein